jgi:Na+:H+ antiporter
MEQAFDTHHLILILGILIAVSLWIKAIFSPLRIAPLTAFILIGMFLRYIGDQFHLFPDEVGEMINFLGEIGVIIILFNAGLECQISRLVSQFSRASYLAICNVFFCALLGYSVSYYYLELPIVTCLFIAVAMTATSIGVTVSIWSDAKADKTKEGGLLLSLVAIDDIIGILLMALLFEVAPLIHQESTGLIWSFLFSNILLFSGKLTLFVALCTIFSLYIEPRLMRWITINETKPDRIITILSHGFIIASIAGIFGFSLPLGAFFAGIAISHDKKTVQMESSFKTFEEFFGPFFFINIGFLISTAVFSSEFLFITFILCIVAFVGKYLGTFIPAMSRKIQFITASLLGVCMIPRAEIALVVMEKGRSLGDWAVSEEVYSSMVVVALITCLLPPFIIGPLISKSILTRESVDVVE